MRHEFSWFIQELTTEEAQAKVFDAFSRVMPNTDSLGKEYAEAIHLLSQDAPVLAYRMRHLNRLVDHLQRVPSEFAEFIADSATAEDHAVIAAFLDHSYPEFIRILEDASLELALLHDIRTRLKVRSLFLDEVTFKEFFSDFVDKMPEPDRSLVIRAIPPGLDLNIPD